MTESVWRVTDELKQGQMTGTVTGEAAERVPTVRV